MRNALRIIAPMKLTRGTYEGASEFAKFDRPTEEMTPLQMEYLLDSILERATPGLPNADLIFAELAIAEENARCDMRL